MAIGTLLCTLPAFGHIGVAYMVGVALSGFCAMPILLSWFDEYAALPNRAVMLLAAAALLFSAVLCFAISHLQQETGAVLMGLAPIVSFITLPPKRNTHSNDSDTSGVDHPLPSFAKLLTQAVSWRTLLGIVIVFFVMGSLGVAAPKVNLFRTDIEVAFLLYPLAIAAFFVAAAHFVRKRIDASIMFKLLLIALASLLFALVFMDRANISLIFYSYITCDVLLWTVLVLASKSTPVEPFAVFIIGWLAECFGNVVGHNVAEIIAGTPQFAMLTGLLIIVAVGFSFSEGLFVFDLEEDSEAEGLSIKPIPTGEDRVLGSAHIATSKDTEIVEAEGQMTPSAAEREAFDGGTAADPIADFVDRHGLSRREKDVFELWVTGHGLKYIQDNLFISESTVKTHMRNIYRKCGVHNRAEIIDLFESESNA